MEENPERTPSATVENNNDQPGTLWDKIRKSRLLKPIAGIIAGGIAGYLYYHFVGCASGSCAITSNPYMSVIFGSALGFYATNSPCSRNQC